MIQADVLSDRDAMSSEGQIDMKLEAVVIPVSDVARAMRFYGDLDWRLDADFVIGESFRVVQMTPPGSPCSVHFGTGITSAKPGSASGLFLIVSDIVSAHAKLLDHGVDASEIYHTQGPGTPSVPGPHPERQSYCSYAPFRDPDGNEWLMQEVTSRLPGRVDPNTVSFSSQADLAGAFRRAEAAHGEHEKRTGKRDQNWPEWYASYMIAEQSAAPLPT